MSQFEQTWTALITPFHNQQVDFDSLRKLVKFQLDGGVSGFVISGTTGESPTLNTEEKKKIFDFVKSEVAGAVPLIVGTGTNSTSETVELSKKATSWGADGILVVVPYYNKPPQRGLVQHYQAVSQSTRLPILLYNVPGRTVAALALDSIYQLSKEKNIVGIKEATGDVAFGKQILDKCGSSFLLSSGDDGTAIDLALQGARGVISVLSHVIPKEFSELFERATKKDSTASGDFKKYKVLTDKLFCEANPIPVKAALQMMGIIKSDELRLPLSAMKEDLRKELQKEMKACGLL
ncbi:MAG: 4-hydroxy-tetrahydrodipicolinate synthase [Bdellovibrionales bacterium]